MNKKILVIYLNFLRNRKDCSDAEFNEIINIMARYIAKLGEQ